MIIGKRLKELRKASNLTQKGFAKKNNIDYTYIGKIERGEQNPSLNILEKIAGSLNIKLEYFFSDKPIETYLPVEDKNNKKRKKILNLLCNLEEEELVFILKIINFLNRYKSVKSYDRTLKVAEKKDKYKTGNKKQ